MGSTPTTINPLSLDDFANRLVQVFPPWSSPDSRSPGGTVYGLFETMGEGLSFLDSAFAYACDATRIQTAQNGALDLASQDYFGSALPRLAGETDDSFRARILAAMLPAGATRAAVTAAVAKVTGSQPRVIEPWRPADTGVWGHFYWGVDNAVTPFRWTGGGRYVPGDPSTGLQYQGFIECQLPTPNLLGGNAVPCYDSNFFWDSPGSAFFNLEAGQSLGPQVVYDAINATKCEGTIVWVKFVNLPPGLSWDEPGETWDEPSAVWS